MRKQHVAGECVCSTYQDMPLKAVGRTDSVSVTNNNPTSACVSIPQHTSAYVSIRQHRVSPSSATPEPTLYVGLG